MLARKMKAEIKFLHVVEVSQNDSINTSGGPSNVSTVSDNIFVHEALKAAHESLGRSYVLHNLENEEDIQVSQTIRIGRPHQHVLACIEQEQIDLVVMGTKGAWGYSDVLVGSNTEKIVRRATCPVLSVKSAVPESAFGEIVLATEISDREQVVVNQVKKIQEMYGSRVHLVWINTRRHFRPDKLSKSLLREFAEKRGLTNYEVHVFSDSIPEDGIRHFANEINGGMIAMGTSSHTGLARVFRGSIAEDTVNHAKRPVLTVSMR